MTDLDTIIQNGKSGNERSALNDIAELPYQYPEIVELLQWMQDKKNVKDKKVRNEAKNLLKQYKSLPLASEVEGTANQVETGDGYSDEIGDSDLEAGEYEHESNLSSREEDRLEAEAAGKGLAVLLKEELKLKITSDGKVEEVLPGEGLIAVKNTGSQNRIYGIDLNLENVGEVKVEEGELDENIVIGDLDAQETWEQKYSFEKEFDPIEIKIAYFDPESGLSPDFLGKEDVGFVCKITGTNTYEQAINNFELTKTIGEYGNVVDYSVSHGEVSTADKDVIFKIEKLEPGEVFEFSINLTGTLPEGVEAYETGETNIRYEVADLTVSPLEYKAVDGISDAKQRIRRREREEEPGFYDCEFNFENLSEFTYDMLELKIFPENLGQQGTVDPIIDWDGLSVSEEEREIQPTEKNDFEFVFESPDKTPTFGSIVKFGVQSFPNILTAANLSIPSEKLKFIKMVVEKEYALTEVASYSRTEVPASVVVKGIGTQPLEALTIKDKVPEGFDNVDRETVEVYLNGELLTEGYELSGDALDTSSAVDSERYIEVIFEHLDENEKFNGGLNKDDVIEIKYPTAVIKPPKDSEPLKGGVVVEGFIYAKEEDKIYAEAEDEIVGLTVIHQRINIDVGKSIQGVTRDGEKAFKITLEGENYGSKATSFVLSDFVPNGFNIVDGPYIEPSEVEESEESVEGGIMKSWSFENIEPDTMFTVSYVIVGEPNVVFNPREAQVMGQA